MRRARHAAGLPAPRYSGQARPSPLHCGSIQKVSQRTLPVAWPQRSNCGSISRGAAESLRHDPLRTGLATPPHLSDSRAEAVALRLRTRMFCCRTEGFIARELALPCYAAVRYGGGGALYTLLWQINFVPINFDQQGDEVYTNEASSCTARNSGHTLLTTSGTHSTIAASGMHCSMRYSLLSAFTTRSDSVPFGALRCSARLPLLSARPSLRGRNTVSGGACLRCEAVKSTALLRELGG